MAETRTGEKGRKKKRQADAKRINVELAPGTSALLNDHIMTQNSSPDRTRALLTYTDVINKALDLWLVAQLKNSDTSPGTEPIKNPAPDDIRS